MIVLVMGVSGSGKSTTGRRLADALKAVFIEADALHPPESLAKMRRGEPLDDGDRWPWLDALADFLAREVETGHDVVVACSALKQAYRERLLGRWPDARIVYLHGDEAILAERMAGRDGHFMPLSLLPSQLAALEPPEQAIEVGIELPVEAQVERILGALEAGASMRSSP